MVRLVTLKGSGNSTTTTNFQKKTLSEYLGHLPRGYSRIFQLIMCLPLSSCGLQPAAACITACWVCTMTRPHAPQMGGTAAARRDRWCSHVFWFVRCVNELCQDNNRHMDYGQLEKFLVFFCFFFC